MANNRNHPVHQSNLVKNLRKSLRPKLKSNEWKEFLAALRYVHNQMDGNPYAQKALLTADSLISAFHWPDYNPSVLYWASMHTRSTKIFNF